jgi:hypothetical protein
MEGSLQRLLISSRSINKHGRHRQFMNGHAACLLTDRDKMSNLYREPSIDASYQVSVHLAKRFLLLLEPVIFTKNSMGNDLDVLSISLLTYYAAILE